MQGLNVLATSALGILEWSWIGSALILLALAVFISRLWKSSTFDALAGLTAAWRAPWPWLIGLLLVIQIIAYPPTMSDSLCYRLPRLFLALQEGGVGRFSTEEDRINGMPWGWEFLALPFAALNILNLSKLINLAAWAIAYQILFSFARQRATSASHARWIALALSTAPVFLLQAASTANDLYAATLLLIGVWMIHRFSTSPGPVPVMASLLALILAANAKPQFLAFGLPWLLWWALSPGKPWKQVPWFFLAAAAPIYFLVSPLWLLFENHQLTGNLLGFSRETALTHEAPAWMMIAAGTIQFAVSQFQMPILPKADAIGAAVNNLPGFDALATAVPKFSPGVQPMIVIDGASIGLVHFAILILGILLCIRQSGLRHWPWIAAFLFGFAVASSQVVPATIGRSFVGFFALLLPLAAIGLANARRQKWLRPASILAVLVGTTAIVLNPASPVWPSKTLQSIAEKRKITGLVKALDHYHAYQDRASTGAGILDSVPTGETVGVLVRRVTPITSLWQPDWKSHRIEFVNLIEPEGFAEGPTDWLVVAENAAEFLPEATEQYSNLPGWQPVQQKTYLHNIRRGPETWTLYRSSE